MVHAILTSTCDIDIEFFPFDQQICDLIFSSWTMDVNSVRHAATNANHEIFTISKKKDDSGNKNLDCIRIHDI